MRYLPLLFLIFLCFPALSQDRIELGYQTSKRGIEWVRPGLPTHVPTWRVSRDTNAIIWHDKSTGMRYDFSYLTETWFARGTFSSTLPPLPTQTSGSATIDNRTGFWLNASNVLHRYDKTQTAWVPFKISFQSAAPSNVASGVSNGAAIYTTSLWQDSDDYLVYYWDGDSWELLSGAGTNLTYTGTSSPVTLNSSTGTDVTLTAGTNISISATGTNLTINNTGAAALSGVVNQVPYFNTTSAITTEAGSGANSLTWDNTNNRLGVGTTSPSAVIEAAVPASTNGIVSNYTYAIGMSQRPLKVVNQDGLETFAVGGNRTSNEGNIFLNAPSVQGGGAGITFSANNGATPVTGLFQLDNSGNLVFRQGSAGASLFYDFGSGVYFRNSSFSNVDHINGSGWLSIAAGNTHPRTLYVNGEARIADLTTDTPTGVVGADADGDLGLLAFSGMSIISGTLTATDGSTTNELQTISVSANTTTLSNSGGSMTIAGGGINTVGTAGTTITITGTEVDGSVGNEGALTVGAGTGTTSVINSNTSGSTGVTLTAGSGLTISETGNVITLANSAPDQTVSLTGAGINNVTGTYPNFTITGTEVDGSVTNEGALTVGAGTGTTSIINSNTSGSTGITLTASTGLSISETGNVITLTNTSPDQTVSLTGAGITNVTGTYPNFTITSTEVDGSTTNELQTISVASNTTTLSNSGGSMTIAGAGINTVGTAGSTITITGTEVDGSISNEGSLTVGAGSGTTSIINSNTSGSTGVTLTAGSGLTISETGNVITLANSAPDQTVSITGAGINVVTGAYPNFTVTGTEVDGSTTNELQTYGHAGTTTYTNTLSGGGGSWSITGAGIAAISQTGGAITVTATEVDGSTTNELQTISVSANTTTLSNSGGSMTIAGGGINTVGTAGTTITITGTEVDGSVSNEGSLTVGAGSGTTSIINSNTSGSTGVTLTAGSGLTISETGNVITLANSAPDQTVSITGAGINAVTGTYPNFTITGTEVDGSVTNEAQSLTVTGTTSGKITLSTAGGAGGGEAVIAAGTGITIGQSGGTITVTNSSPATAGWLLDGNTITAAKRIGSNDNFDVVVETNNTDRIFIDNAGTVSIGGTQLTTAALNINGLQTGTGMLIAGGGSLVGPNFYTATGSGTGSTATVLSGVLSMISGNVEALLKNTATTGTGGGSVITLNVSPTATSNDPFIKWQTEATTDWSMGIDNDDVDDLKLHRFSRPSDNNGQGTIEFGYRTNDIGMVVNKTGIGTTTNGFYAVDAYGKIRTDQYVNNALDISNSAFATIALGTAAGTSPTVDNTITSVWGNGAHLKFTSGSSPTANGVICTVTLSAAYTFNDCVSNISARTTNASGFGYSSTFNSATRVITFTLNGTLTASTVYEFNLMFFGRN